MEGTVAVKNRKEFGDLILEKRKEKNLSLQKLSNEIGGEITPSYINRLEKKEKGKPSFDVVCQLAQALEMDLKQVFESFGYGSMLPQSEAEKTDIMLTDNQGNVLVVECKSLNGISVSQTDLLQKTINRIVDYAVSDWEGGYGHLPGIIQLVEEFRRESRK